MKLYAAIPSPFVRKVRITMALRGLDRQVALLPTDVNDADGPLHGANPLGKIPVLELDDGTTLYDSAVIAEYIDSIGTEGAPVFPAGAARWPALRNHALGDGICEAALACVYEARYRPADMQYAPWVERQRHRITAAVGALETAPPDLGGDVTIGEIAIASALGYLDFRLEGDWRAGHPRMVAWLDNFAEKVPAFAATAPV